MSRRTYQAQKYAAEQWPALAAFLTATVHGDDRRTVQDDIEAALAGMPLCERQTLARDWWSWNATAGTSYDVRFAIEAFDFGMAFDTALHARNFMNDLYDRVVVSARREA